MALRWLARALAALVFAVALLAASNSSAQEADAGVEPADAGETTESADAGVVEETAAPPGNTIVPPQPIGDIQVPYPADATPRDEPALVKVLLTIGPTGAVTAVQLAEGVGEPFDSAVLEAVKKFKFRPATMGGKPVAVVVPFTQTFLTPVAPPAEGEEQKLESLLEGIVVERGTRKPVANATVAVRDAQGERTATTDEAGHFTVPVAAGESKVTIVGTGLRPFMRVEKLKASEDLKVKYLIDREKYDPYESIVIGTRERTEIARTTLSGREIHQLPGTFGDPFRVVAELPGVTSIMSLLPMPVVRGSSPGDTGVFLDGVRLPMLYHLFAGPSVIHPEFLDRVDFYPGGFPVTYGGYTAGIIDGQTARPRYGDSRIDVDLNLQQVGAFVKEPIPGTDLTVTVAGRYGYPGLLLSLLSAGVTLNYWDYQARLDGGSARSAWSIFFFGAQDEVKANSPGQSAGTGITSSLGALAMFMFHRLDLRWRLGDELSNANFRLIFGYDETNAIGGMIGTRSYFVEPKLSGTMPITRWLSLDAGLELVVRNVENPPATSATNSQVQLATMLVSESGLVLNGGVYLEAPLRPLDSLLIVPGVRADVYHDKSATPWSIDPRLTVRWKPTSFELWLKGVVGRYHQPPRIFVAVPGMDQSKLDLGLLASTQVGLGVEVTPIRGLELDVQGYYNDMNPVIFDLSINESVTDVQPSGPTTLPGHLDPAPGTQTPQPGFVDLLYTKRVGRSYGLEVMLRKRDSRDGVFGWLAYTLSHSERKYDTGWAAYDFDRTHIFNAVVGVRLPHNWEIGARLLLQSGTPITTVYGYNAGRSDWQFRADLRVDKRAVWNNWMLDFYVDIINTTVAEETGGVLGSFSFRYVLPTVGFRVVL